MGWVWLRGAGYERDATDLGHPEGAATPDLEPEHQVAPTIGIPQG